MKTLDTLAVRSKIKTHDISGKELSLIDGVYVNFADIDSDDPEAIEVRQATIVKAAHDFGLKEKPMLVFDIAPAEALELIGDDGDVDCSGSKGMAKVMVPCSAIVDITSLKPKMGESAVRCNPAYPHYRWFQAINAILAYKNETSGRVIPFPLKVADEEGKEELIYHVMRVNRAEYDAYQKLLVQAVANDGTEMGFYHAAKFSYEILSRRGYKQVTEKEVGEAVTKVTMMGRPEIKAVIINNCTAEDFEGRLRTNHYIYST